MIRLSKELPDRNNGPLSGQNTTIDLVTPENRKLFEKADIVFVPKKNEALLSQFAYLPVKKIRSEMRKRKSLTTGK